MKKIKLALVFILAGLSLLWWWAKGTKWAVGWGWLEKPARGPRPKQTVDLFRFFQETRSCSKCVEGRA